MGLLTNWRRTPSLPPPTYNPGEALLQALGQQVQGVFCAQGIPVDIDLRIQGARVNTVVLAPHHVSLQDLPKVSKMGALLEYHLGAGVRVTQERGRIYVEVPRPDPVDLQGTGQGFTLSGLQIALGLSSRNELAVLDLVKAPHVLAVGPTQSGKSTAARALVYHALAQNDRGVKVGIISGRPADWSGLVGYDAYGKPTVAAGCWGMIPPEQAPRVLRWLQATGEQRERRGMMEPRIILVVDDLVALIGKHKGDVVDPLSWLTSNGRAGGIHLVLCTQRLGERGAGDAVVSGNIRTRLIFGTADAQDAAAFVGRGESGAERLTERGDCLYSTPQGIKRITVAQVVNEDLALLPRRAFPVLPWEEEWEPTPRGIRRVVTAGDTSPVTEEGGILPATQVLLPLPGGDITGYTGDRVVTGGDGPLLPRREPTPEDARVLRGLRQKHGVNETLRLAYGGKNKRYSDWLQMAMEMEEDKA